MRRLTFGLPALAALCLVVAACSGKSGTTSPSNPGGMTPSGNGALPASVNTSIIDYGFSPAVVHVAVGGQVTWTNTGQVAHTVTADSGAFSSGQLGGATVSSTYGTVDGGTFTQTFGAAGTFKYHCSNHPTMTGTVVVGS